MSFERGAFLSQRSQATGHEGRWCADGRPVTIWEIRGRMPLAVQEDPAHLCAISRQDGYFEILQLEKSGDVWTLVAEAPRGRPLEEVVLSLGQERPFPYIQLGALLEQICRCLGPLHDLGIPSRGVGTGGILIDEQTGSIRIDLTEAMLPRTTVDWLEMDAGTTVFQPQEVVRGFPVVSSDLYSLAMLIYLALAGAAPYRGCRGEDLIERIVGDDKIINRPELEEGAQDFWETLRWALSRTPEERNLDLDALSTIARQLQVRMRPHAIVSRLLRRGELARATALAEEFIETGLALPEVLQLRELQFQAVVHGLPESRRGPELRRAERYLREAIRCAAGAGLPAQEGQLRARLADFFLSAGLRVMAREEMERAVILCRDDFGLTLQFARMLLALKEADGAIKVLERMREKYPYHPDVALQLIYALLHGDGDVSRAEEVCRDALGSLQGNRELLLLYADICGRQGRGAEAIQILESLDTQATDFAVQNALAGVYLGVGDRARAVRHLLHSLNIRGGQHDVLDKLVDMLGGDLKVMLE